MRLPRKQAALLHDVIERWRQDEVLLDAQAEQLDGTIEVQPFDWRLLAKYSFWVALICIVTAVSSVLADKVLAQLIERLFDAPHVFKCAGMAIVAAGLYWWGVRHRALDLSQEYRNGAIFFLGVLATAGAIYQLGLAVDTGSGHFSILLLLSFFVYSILGVAVDSNLIWVFANASLGGWMGTETGYRPGWGAYYFGMNFPVRFMLFGGVLTACALALETHQTANDSSVAR